MTTTSLIGGTPSDVSWGYLLRRAPVGKEPVVAEFEGDLIRLRTREGVRVARP